MIWFSCKQCGKKQGRGDEQAGSLVFCTCGQANRVPWESEAGAEEAPQSFPRVWVDESAPRTPARRWDQPQTRPQNPGHCFNHTQAPATQTCSACLLEFCANCLVKLGDQSLCGPCKNFRLMNLTRPARPSALAIVSLALGLVGGPIAACITSWAAGNTGAGGMGLAFCIIGLVLPAVSLFLGIMAIWNMERNRRVGGRSMAVMGLMSGIASVLWCVTIIGILAYRMAGG